MLHKLLLLLSVAGVVSAQQPTGGANADWTRPFPPFRIIGNIYWVGTYDLSTYLIVTPQGNILINTGLADTVNTIKTNVEQLGFKLTDTKILTATHGHYDHVAGMAALERMTGATLAISEPDAELLESGGKKDFRFGNMASAQFEPVKVDRLLKDGEHLTLGGTDLTVHHHPGHTKGAVSFTLTVQEDGKPYRVVIANLGSINPGVTVSGMPGYPGIADDYARTFREQKAMTIDVFLASHAAQFGLHEKYKPGDPFRADRFVDPQGFRAAVERLEKAYVDQLAGERRTR